MLRRIAVGSLASFACNTAEPAVFTSTSSGADATTVSATTDDGATSSATTTTTGEPTSSDASTAVDPDTSGDGESGTTGSTIDCPAPPACDAPPPNPGPNVEWNDGNSPIVVGIGAPVHRGRDMFYNPGDAQWVLAKFAYGFNDWDLEGERIDLFLLRDCGEDWESLGTTLTTYEGEHGPIEGVDDTGGRVYFEIPAAQALGLGRHRVHMFVRGDGTGVAAEIEIIEPGTPMFMADVDGTLTTTETEEFTALLGGVLPDVNPSAPEVMWALVDLGYRPMYLTARPEFLGARTRAFIEERGLPPGIIHTTLNFGGALGNAAVTYKTAELAALAARGLVPAWAFGNTSSDADAYEAGAIQPLAQRVFFQYDDEHGGRRIDDYAELLPELAAAEPVCR